MTTKHIYNSFNILLLTIGLLFVTGCIEKFGVNASGGYPVSLGTGKGDSQSTGKVTISEGLTFSTGHDNSSFKGWLAFGARFSHSWFDNTVGQNTVGMYRTEMLYDSMFTLWPRPFEWFIPALSFTMGVDWRTFTDYDGYDVWFVFGPGLHLRFYIPINRNVTFMISPVVEYLIVANDNIGGNKTMPIYLNLGFDFDLF